MGMLMMPVTARPVRMGVNAAFTWPVPQFFYQRGFHAKGALHLKSGMGYVVFIEENFLYIA